MIGKTLRGVAAALLIGTAGVAGAALLTASVAQAAGARPEVGKPLKAAIDAAKAGNSKEAMAELHKAESVHGLTAEEQKLISETRQYIEVKTGNFSGGVTNATSAQAKFATDYNAGRYHDVVGQDQDYLRKYGVLDDKSRQIIAQAYYQMGDYKGALRYLDGMGNSDAVLELRMASAAKLGDTQQLGATARELVLKGQSKFWPYLLTAADHTGGLDDEETLAVFRIRLLTGNMRNADDYSTATQIAIQLGYPQEAVAIQQAGFTAKVLSGERQQRLLDLAKKNAAAQAAQMPALAKTAEAAKTGDDLVHLAEVDWGIGKYQDALGAAQAGIKKGGLKNPDHAKIVEGMALVGLKKNGDASKAFKAAETDPKHKAVADLWDVYARSSK